MWCHFWRQKGRWVLTETGTQTRNRSGEPRPAKHTEEPASPQMTWHMEFSWGRKKKKEKKSPALVSTSIISSYFPVTQQLWEGEKKSRQSCERKCSIWILCFFIFFVITAAKSPDDVLKSKKSCVMTSDLMTYHPVMCLFVLFQRLNVWWFFLVALLSCCPAHMNKTKTNCDPDKPPEERSLQAQPGRGKNRTVIGVLDLSFQFTSLFFFQGIFRRRRRKKQSSFLEAEKIFLFFFFREIEMTEARLQSPGSAITA